MSYARYVLRRAALAVASAYAVVTVAFLIGTAAIGTDIQNALALARWGGSPPAEIERLRRSLRETYRLDEPLLDRLVGWWTDVATLDLGYSAAFDAPVVAVLDGRLLTTLEYVVPGLVLAAGLGIPAGLFAALRKDGVFDFGFRLGTYVLYGIPAFMVAVYLLSARGGTLALPAVGTVRLPDVGRLTIAAATVAASLLAGQLRFARASALEQTGEAFVKMLRAKGAGRLRLARHVLRNAALPILSLSISELLAVLVLNMYVIERALDVEGLARVSLRAIGVEEGFQFQVMADIPLLMGSVLVIVCVGISLSFCQDVLRGYLDPRVGAPGLPGAE